MNFSKIINESWIWKYLISLTGFNIKKVILSLFLMVIIGLTEGIGLLLLVPLLQLAGLDVQQGALNSISVYVSSFLSYMGIEPTLAAVLVVYVLVIGLNAFLVKIQEVKISQVQYGFAAHLRKRLFDAITNSDWLFFISKRSSDLAHALTYEIERIVHGTGQFLFLISSSIILAVYIIFALQISGIISGLIFLIGLILLLLLKNRAQSISTTGEKLSLSSKDMYESTNKQLDGMKTIRSFNMEDKNIQLFDEATTNVSNRYVDSVRSYADVKFLFQIGSVVVLSFLVYVLIVILALPIAEILILLYLFVRIIPTFSRILSYYQFFINMLPAFKTVLLLEDEFSNANEGRDRKEFTEKKDIKFKESMKLENISFSYNRGQDGFSLKNLNINIKAGQITALAGQSGAGKSTIIDIIMGFIKPQEGQVTVDEVPLKDVPRWRDKIGYVAQETFLFNDTIRNNLLVADPEADEDKIKEALRQASALKFTFKLPNGLDTLIGERAVMLSGGERQRIALARALLRKPTLLILDEATSNLDSENEKRILDVIEKLHGEMTILMITHRLSTIRNVDYIYLIEEGVVDEGGNWDELLEKKDGKFKGFYGEQV